MAQIIINNRDSINGKLSVSRHINENKDGFIIQGSFSTHLYYEQISTLETSRFKVSGIEVYEEGFGSDDYDIVYNFIAKKITLKDYISDGVGYILYPEEMEKIEEEMYKDDHPILGGIGKEYKDMFIETEVNDDEEHEEEDDE